MTVSTATTAPAPLAHHTALAMGLPNTCTEPLGNSVATRNNGGARHSAVSHLRIGGMALRFLSILHPTLSVVFRLRVRLSQLTSMCLHSSKECASSSFPARPKS